jgi:Sulfotransferase family
MSQASLSSWEGSRRREFVDWTPKKPPVYIMSPMQRCGTNHLADVVMLNPDFQLPKVLNEDFVLLHANLLSEYCERTHRRWKHLKWIEDPDECGRLLELHLGQAILSLLGNQIDENKRLLLKTPDSNNINKFFQFFPGAKLLLLMRDGRDVVASFIRKHPNSSEEHWMRKWTDGSRRILDFTQGPERASRGKSWELVRYEALVEHPEDTLKGMSDFLGVEESAFEWDKLAKLPVRGSAFVVDTEGRVIAGAVVEKPKGFSPIGRWRDWGFWRKRKFKKIAGRELIELGYESNDRW